MERVKVVPVLNTDCHRTVFMVFDGGYDKRGKSVRQLYDDCHIASFNQSEAARYAIRHNLDHLQKQKDNAEN